MIKVMLVDDEVLALNYLRNLINWEERGYKIAAATTNGKSALEAYEQYKPEIVISDICMIGMDGLELAMRLKEQNSDVVIILLSAYKDFEYAQKGIRYGVANYLLKHELNEVSLIKELENIRQNLDINSKKKKLYQQYFIKQLIYNPINVEEQKKNRLGKRLFLLMIHRNNSYINGKMVTGSWSEYELEMLIKVAEKSVEDIVSFVADVQITSNNIMIVYEILNTSSKYIVNGMIEQKCTDILDCLKMIMDCKFNLIYSLEIRQSEISLVFQNMARQVRYAVFWEENKHYCITKLPQIVEEDKVVWRQLMGELETTIYEGEESVEIVIRYIFELINYPSHKIDIFYQLTHALNELLMELEEREGIVLLREERELYKILEIEKYYVNMFTQMQQVMIQRDNQRYSEIVLKIMRYIRKNYQGELSLEVLGEEFQMNGIYLGQVFKRETGVTFLKYLTSCRMEEAKKNLEAGKKNIAEISELVGYKTSQYFSQIFTKTVGIKPQEYKKWKGRKNTSI
jgi:Response regulator containing CheY-like receiver domain and AraC-type DNA-binding domain